MRWSKYFLQTVREVPGDAEAVSHVLLTRARHDAPRSPPGMYALTPLGLRAHRKTEADRARGDGPRRGSRAGGPDPAAEELWEQSGRWERYALGGDPLSPEGPQGRRLLPRPDGGGGRDHDGRVRHHLLPPAAGDALPDPDEVPRRDPSALRPDARARVPDVRRLFLRRGRRGPGPAPTARRTPPTGASSSAAGSTSPSSRRTRARSAAATRRSSWCWPTPARTRSSGAPRADTAPTSSGRGRRGGRAPWEDETMVGLQDVETPGMGGIDDVVDFLGITASRMIKCLVYETDKGFVVALLRGDLDVNEVALKNALGVEHLALASEDKVESGHRRAGRLRRGLARHLPSIGVRIVADESVRGAVNAVTGAGRTRLARARARPIDRDARRRRLGRLRGGARGRSLHAVRQAARSGPGHRGRATSSSSARSTRQPSKCGVHRREGREPARRHGHLRHRRRAHDGGRRRSSITTRTGSSGRSRWLRSRSSSCR